MLPPSPCVTVLFPPVLSFLPSPFSGGPGASTHVEILGNQEMLADLLLIASGRAEDMGDIVHSDIRGIAARIPWDELGGNDEGVE